MTTSAYMPDVVVEIAFDSGFSTPAASRTWTDVSSYVELAQGINISRGRGDEFANCDPNRMSLTLDNRDGRFTAGKSDGAYYPNVKIGRPIRVTSTPVGGAASVRFLGYVDEWPVEWTGAASYAMAKIGASSRMARLGFDGELRSTLSEECLASLPFAYYPLGEPAEATIAADVTGVSDALAITGRDAALTFAGATGPATDAAPAVMFAGGKYLEGALTPTITSGPPNPSLEAWISTTATTGVIANLYLPSMYLNLSVVGGFLQGQFGSGRTEPVPLHTVTSPTQVNDGDVTHVAVEWVDGFPLQTMNLYVNGALAASTTTAPTISSFSSSDFALSVGEGFVGGISHVMVGTEVAGIATRYAAGIDGIAGETAGQRITRYAGYAGIPSAEVSADVDTNAVSAIDTTDKTVIDSMRAVEETEYGVLFDGRDNTLTFHGRARRYNAATAFTLDATLQEVEAGIAPRLDRSSLLNDVTGTAADGSTARAVHQASVDDYGYARETVEIASTPDAAFQAASWRVNTYGEPAPRVPSLGVDLLPLTQARQDSLFTLDVSSKIAVSNMPAQAPAATATYFIEGYAESIGVSGDGAQFYTFDFNVSPTTGYDVWVCEDATYGAFDEYPIAQ